MFHSSYLDETHCRRLTSKYDHPILLIYYNTTAIDLSKNTFMHSKTKHIPTKFYFLREEVSLKKFKVEYVDIK
jgi:hypothetical protein